MTKFIFLFLVAILCCESVDAIRATVTREDGSKYTVTDLSIGGSIVIDSEIPTWTYGNMDNVSTWLKFPMSHGMLYRNITFSNETVWFT